GDGSRPEWPPVILQDVVIHEADAARTDVVLRRSLADSSSAAALLIDRSGQPLAETGTARTLDVGSIGALAAGAFASTAALARLLGESEVAVRFHDGGKARVRVYPVGEHSILPASHEDATTGGMARPVRREDAGA